MPPRTTLAPVTRLEEIIRGRNASRLKLAEAAGIPYPRLARIAYGQMGLPPALEQPLADALDCHPRDFHVAVGSPMPPIHGTAPADVKVSDVFNGEGYIRRRRYVAAMLGTDMDGLLRYEIYGDMSRMGIKTRREIAVLSAYGDELPTPKRRGRPPGRMAEAAE